MPRFVVLGSTPGDGGVVRAKGFMDAFVRFMQDSWADGPEQAMQVKTEILAEQKSRGTKLIRIDKNHATYGDYEINKIGE